ncbi:MAG TPA: Mpo1-like protein [Gammaproteobacteria bacterium]|nr:Mpo1-like protein [Gammaproteobacteria bacterium]
MKTLSEQLVQYAGYHRDKRNIIIHLFGIPLIVFAIAILLSRPTFLLPGLAITASPVWFVVAAVCLFYLVLDIRFGLVMSLLLALTVWAASWFATQSTTVWLAWGIGLFVFGWVLQFIGHIYEGRKPAFVDDIIGLLIGPLFVVAEIAFMLGLCKTLQHTIESQAK